ncbi:hypothetical protein EVJ02_17510 [Salmonella enterica subsp. enterica serovar Kedougou]|nr:hypothetical protein [Salmonella enterica subsp. enterica serovar Kedougou]
MTTVNKEAIRNFVINAINGGRDELLNYLCNQARSIGMNDTPFMDNAVLVATYFVYNRRPENETGSAIMATFKSTLYAELLNRGMQPLDPRIHSQLEQEFRTASQYAKQAKQIIAQANQQPNAFGGPAPMSSPSMAMPASGFAGNGYTNPQSAPAVQGGSIPMSNYNPMASAEKAAAQQQGNFGQPAPQAPQPAPQPQVQSQQPAQPQDPYANIPQAVQNASKPVELDDKTIEALIERYNKPIDNIFEVDRVEDYFTHELKEMKKKIALTPEEMNKKIKNSPYSSHHNWGEKVDEIIDNEDVDFAVYDEADIMVKTESEYKVFPMACTENSKVYLQEFYTASRQIVDDLDSVRNIEDPEEMLKRVIDDVFHLRTMSERLTEYFNTKAEEPEALKVSCMEFCQHYNATLTILVHNAICVATNYGKGVPGSKFVQFDCNLTDLEYFRDTVYPRTIGDNGVTTAADFFRELCLLIARSVRKLHFRLKSNDTAIEVCRVTYTIQLPTDYPSAKGRNVVEISSFGTAFEPIVSIYEAINQRAPEANVKLVTPTATYTLHSNGEITAPVRY